MIMNKIKLIVLAATLALTGCAYLRSTTTHRVEYEGTNRVEIVKTTIRSCTLFDSEAQLAKFNNRGQLTSSNEWAPGTAIGTLNQSSSSTNLNAIIVDVVGAAVTAATKGAKP